MLAPVKVGAVSAVVGAALLASIADVLPGMGAIFAVAVGRLGLVTLRGAGAERREELLPA